MWDSIWLSGGPYEQTRHWSLQCNGKSLFTSLIHVQALFSLYAFPLQNFLRCNQTCGVSHSEFGTSVGNICLMIQKSCHNFHCCGKTDIAYLSSSYSFKIVAGPKSWRKVSAVLQVDLGTLRDHFEEVHQAAENGARICPAMDEMYAILGQPPEDHYIPEIEALMGSLSTELPPGTTNST